MPYKNPETQRRFNREWAAKRRAAFFADKACATCGSSDALQLHHRDPATKVAHAIWTWREERRLEEIAKCDILCRACHEQLHATQMERHGTVSRYRHGCRCGLCRWAKMQEMALYRERKRAKEAVQMGEERFERSQPEALGLQPSSALQLGRSPSDSLFADFFNVPRLCLSRETHCLRNHSSWLYDRPGTEHGDEASNKAVGETPSEQGKRPKGSKS